MADSLVSHLYDTSGVIDSTGSANAYLVRVDGRLNAYHRGMPPIRFKANFSNTGAATVNVSTENAPSGLGAVNLRKLGGGTALASGDIISGGIYTIIYDGSVFQMLELTGPSALGSISVDTLTVNTDANPDANDGAGLGTGALSWSDLFLASGGVINWANGDVTITHSSNQLAFAGASSGYSFAGDISTTGNYRAQGATPGLWLDQTDATIKGALTVLDGNSWQVQRRAANFGAFEATIVDISISAPQNSLLIDSTGNLVFLSPSTSPPSLSTNGQVTLTLTSNTNLRISARGSDGTTRVANITLA